MSPLPDHAAHAHLVIEPGQYCPPDFEAFFADLPVEDDFRDFWEDADDEPVREDFDGADILDNQRKPSSAHSRPVSLRGLAFGTPAKQLSPESISPLRVSNSRRIAGAGAGR